MKKQLLFIVLISIALISNGQVELKGMAGFNFSNLSKNPEGTEISGTGGYQFGASAIIGDKFYVEPSIQFVRLARDFETDGDNSTYNVKENWVRVPVHLGYRLGGEDKLVALRVFAGPAVSFLGNYDTGSSVYTKDALEINKTTFSLDGGVGVDILIFFAELNYDYSLTKYSSLEEFDSKNGTFYFNVGVRIPL